MIRKLKERVKWILQFERELARRTPLIHGPETRKIARVVKFDLRALEELGNGAVAFDPREAYFDRVIDWAHE